MKIRKNDTVVVITGKNKNHVGKVLRVVTKTGKVVVEGANKVKRHIRGNSERKGQIAEFEAPIQASNVMIVDPKTKKRSRVGYHIDSKGEKTRIAKKSKSTL